jgi:hypothetical protein
MMETRTDWLPQGHEALQSEATQTYEFLSIPANRERLGFSPLTPYGRWFDLEFTTRYQTFSDAVDDWKNLAERTKLKTDTMNTAEKAFIPYYRQLYPGMLKGNPMVTDTDLEAMGLPKHSGGGGSDAPVATEPPGIDVDTSIIGRLGIHFFKKGHKHKKGKPAGQHGAEIRWMISDTPPARWNDLLHSDIDTHTPFTLEFENDQRGQTVYFALRWENTTGKKGPWSEIQRVIIP